MTNCKNCKGTGNVHVEGHYISKPVDMVCWICGGKNFTNMSREQITWYLKHYKAFSSLKTKSLKTGNIVDSLAWINLKNSINKACGRLGINLHQIPNQRSDQFGVSHSEAFMRVELKEFERRLEAIPLAL